MTTKIPAELSSTPGIADSSNATAITIDSSENITLTGDISLADSKKVNIGAGNDLQIYHDGSNSFIKEAGTGGLYMPTSAVYMRNAADNAGVAYFVDGGAVTLYHDGTSKFATSSNGGIMYGGITFNGDTATANLLDDYEEGLHTVSMTDSGGGATITLNTSFNQLSYTKIGRIVQVSGVLLPSAVSGSFTGTTVISLPFAAADLSDQAGKGFINVETYSVDFTAGTAPAGHIGEGTSTASILVSADNAGYGFARVSTSSQIYVGGTYITSS